MQIVTTSAALHDAMAHRLIALQPETVIIADDHPLFRAAIREALECSQGADDRGEGETRGHDPQKKGQGTTTFLEADSLDSLQALVTQHDEVDLVLLDLHMPGVHGFAGLLYLSQRYPSVPVVIISANEDPAVIRRAMDHGAAGFIPKSSSIEEISEAIGAILMGEPWTPALNRGDLPGRNESEQELAERLAELTPQQYKVLMFMMQGLLNKQIAFELGVSEATIKAHVTAIMNKLGVSNRTQAVVAAARLNVRDPSAAS